MKRLVIERTRYFIFDWKDVEKDALKLAKKIDYKPTMIVGILRGGAIVARLLSDFLGVKKIRTFGLMFYESVGKRKRRVKIYQPLTESLGNEVVLLVDDVVDSGESMKAGKQVILSLKPKDFKVATLHVKPWAKKPDYWAREFDGWLVYPWEKFETLREILKTISSQHTKKEIDKIIKKFGVV